ncbi:MAG: glucosamine-6-phosphate deaminase [Bacteroides thetaiotaomicron]|nr:glucosamine-6-phosphate deaminase [Bacteroides thetaiotaomicron]
MINIAPTPQELGKRAAVAIARLMNESVANQGSARLILSTGASQFETLAALIQMDVPWDKVEMFHLDEYVGLPENHIASFRRYLKERFVSKVPLKTAYFVNGEGNVKKNIAELTAELRRSPVDVGVIGIGENGHIAFNDPPADFTTDDSYKLVTLDERCRKQQVGEGWFPNVDEVPKQAITMCPKQILSCRHIITAAPHSVKAEAVFNTITMPVNPAIPATILKTHPDWKLFIDNASAAQLMPC